MALVQTKFPWMVKDVHAVLSEDGVYRYELWRSLDTLAWDVPRKTVAFGLLNPSKADENTTDPTFEKCVKFGRAWGYKRIVIWNLFAYRETDSRKLLSLSNRRDLVGPDNDRTIARLVADETIDKIVCGWGNSGVIGERSQAVRKLLASLGRQTWCFGTNQNGEPVHPLYQPDLRELMPFPVGP